MLKNVRFFARHIANSALYIIEWPFWRLDRLLYDHSVLVYGGWGQQCLAVAIGSAIGLFIGSAIVAAVL